jgi:hypothetical protein
MSRKQINKNLSQGACILTKKKCGVVINENRGLWQGGRQSLSSVLKVFSIALALFGG